MEWMPHQQVATVSTRHRVLFWHSTQQKASTQWHQQQSAACSAEWCLPTMTAVVLHAAEHHMAAAGPHGIPGLFVHELHGRVQAGHALPDSTLLQCLVKGASCGCSLTKLYHAQLGTPKT